MQSTGEEIVPCTNNAPGLPITDSPPLLPILTATNDATTNESSAEPESSPTTASLGNLPVPLSMNQTPVVLLSATTATTPVSASLLVSASSPVAPVITTSVESMGGTPFVSASSRVAPVTVTPEALAVDESVVAPEPSAASESSAAPSVLDSTAPGPLTPAMAPELLNSDSIVANAMPVNPSTTMPLVSAPSAITLLPVASAIVPKTSEPQPTRQSRRGAQKKKASNVTAASLHSAETGTDEPRRSSRKRPAKHANPVTDSINQPTAKRPRQKKTIIKWAHVVPQPNGQLAMVNSDGTIRGYMTEDSDGKEILVDNDVFDTPLQTPSLNTHSLNTKIPTLLNIDSL
ncbi:hypothetical protein F5878DRAFT_714058 [Lentinula raphanica]|uniref:Uncharacterized protein n=1 Tax=Lentinula raphanica TaxID=153919 RepID=A0AA38U2E2_9AGAR|nr:hypothetical protein F5878DRAFT_714058 [Lentinula raphanica]